MQPDQQRADVAADDAVRSNRCGTCGVRGHNRITRPIKFRPASEPPPPEERLVEIAQLREARDERRI